MWNQKFKSLHIIALLSLTFLFAQVSFGQERTSKNYEPPPPDPSDDVWKSTETYDPIKNSQRIKIYLDEIKTVDLGVRIEKIIVLSPVIVIAEIENERSVRISGITLGETTIIASGGGQRFVIVVNIVSYPSSSVTGSNYAENTRNKEMTGSYSIGILPPTNNSSTFLQHSFYLNRKLGSNKSIRGGADFYHSIGKKESGSYSLFDPRFNLNRLELGLDDEKYSVDILDSSVNLSRSSLENYTVRGFHYQRKDQSKFEKNRKTFDFFGGLARPSYNLFETREGGIVGGMVPVIKKPTFLLRAGAVTVFSKGENATAVRLDGRLEQSRDDVYDFSLDFDKKNISLYGKTSNSIGDFTIQTEFSKVSKTSPFLKISAQTAATRVINASVYWKPNLPIYAFAIVNSTKSNSISANSNLKGFFDVNFLLGSFNYSLNPRTRFNISYVEQNLNTSRDVRFSNNSVTTNFSNSLNTRSFTFRYSQIFAKQFTNEVSFRPVFTKDKKNNTAVNKGFYLQEELRRNWSNLSVSGFVNLRRQTPSIESLIADDPSILPPKLRRLYESNPANFFLIYHNLLPRLLGDLPVKASNIFDVGIKSQGSISRNTFFGEVRYRRGGLSAYERQNNLVISGSYFHRIDESNLIGVSVSRFISNTANLNATTTLNISYTHRFGGSNNGGNALTKLFNLKELFGGSKKKGQIIGKIFRDINNNGLGDESEKGLANIEVFLDDGKTSTVTDANGNYVFNKVSKGTHKVFIKISGLGETQKASTPQEQTIFIRKDETQTADFGLNDRGFISGYVYNDADKQNIQNGVAGIPNVRINIYEADEKGSSKEGITDFKFTNFAGKYNFPSLNPGRYILEVDKSTLPPNFVIPQQNRWDITVDPLKGNYYNLPVSSLRAVTGIVYQDLDGDNIFDPQKDKPLEGIKIVASIKNVEDEMPSFEVKTVSGSNGRYILRNLPIGTLDIQAFSGDEKTWVKVSVQMTYQPETRRNVNLMIPK